MTKRELRKLYLKKRTSLADEDYQVLNNQLVNNFIAAVDYYDIKVLHTYLPIESNKEPDTRPIINYLQKKNPSLKISLPRVNVHSGTLDNVYFTSVDQLKTNSWNILEPAEGISTPVQDIDLVLVPLLCFDRQGYRVGYGKGFYDKFLPQCRVDCKKIGLSLFDPVDSIVDVDEFDVPLDQCVTPVETYSFDK